MKCKKKLFALCMVIIYSMTAMSTGVTVFAAALDSSVSYTTADERYDDVQNLNEVQSYNEEITVSFWLDSNGTPYYDITYRGISVVENSMLGFSLDYGDFTDGFTLLGISRNTKDSHWIDTFNERTYIPDQYNEMTAHLQSSVDGTKMDIIFRAYNEGAAFKYSFPQDNAKEAFVINQEMTYFNLDNSATAYVHHNGNQTEVRKTAVTNLTSIDRGYFRPLTVIGDGYALSVTEAHQVDYTRVHFTTDDKCEAGTIRSMLNGVTTNNNLDPSQVKNEVDVDLSGGAFDTSWRTFVIGAHEGELLNNNYIVKNLNPESAIGDTSWIEPGKALRCTTLNTQGAKDRIDFAAEHGITYVHFDASWYGPEGSMDSNPWVAIDAMDFGAIKAYAEEKGVKTMVYVNYRHLQDQYRKGQLDALFKHYVEDFGISGIKFGFVPIGAQPTTKMVYDWVRIAADNQLIVDIHDEMLNTGYERTYPNLLTLEAIHGDEENPLAHEDLGYLFTRMVAGAADHTWCYNLQRNTTRAFRMAGSLVFFSPLNFLYWYDAPSLSSFTNAELKLWDDMPTVWEESDYIESKIEEYATVIRRSGEEWYLAGITAVDRELDVELSFLNEDTKYVAEIYTDRPNDVNGVITGTYIVDNEMAIIKEMKGNNGLAVRFYPASEEEIAKHYTFEAAAGMVSNMMTAIDNIGEITIFNVGEKITLIERIMQDYSLLGEYFQIYITNYTKLADKLNEIEEIIRPVDDLLLNGQPFSAFDRDTYTYDVILNPGDPVPELFAVAAEGSGVTSVQQVQSLPGNASVTAENAYKSATYTLNFKIPEDYAFVYASDLDTQVVTGRGEFVRDKARTGDPLTGRDAAGNVVAFEKGIGSHAITNITYPLEGQGYTRFQAFTGISVYNGNTGNFVQFKVLLDGEVVYDSGRVTQMDPYGVVDIEIPPTAKEITLVGDDGGDGINFDHANWLDAKFITDQLDPNPDTTPLEDMIKQAQDFLKGLKDTALREKLQGAIDDAAEALGGEITYSGIYERAIALRDILEQVKIKAGLDTKMLEYAVDYANARIEAGDLKHVIGKVSDAFYAALDRAEEILLDVASDDPTVTQDDIDKAVEKLIGIIHYLEFVGDKTDLEKLLATAVKYENRDGEYTPATYAAFTEALSGARTVMDDRDALNADIEEAHAALLDALMDLRLIPDKGHLQQLVKQAKAKDLSLYTAVSGQALCAAVEFAEDILNDREAFEEDVKAAEIRVQTALKKLEPVKFVPSAQEDGKSDRGTAVNEVNANRKTTQASGINTTAAANPKTADTSMAGLVILLALVSLFVLFGLRQKECAEK